MSVVRARVLLLICPCLCGLIGWVSWPAKELSLPATPSGVDDVQYFGPGPDFPWPTEEAALAETAAPSEQ